MNNNEHIKREKCLVCGVWFENEPVTCGECAPKKSSGRWFSQQLTMADTFLAREMKKHEAQPKENKK